MLEKLLIMSFENELGKKVSVTIKDVIEAIDSVKANGLMDFIIEKNIFKTSGGALVKKMGCEIVSKETTEIVVG